MIDFKKYVKYSKAGPRYTSYPTALEFNEEFDAQKYEEKIVNLKDDDKLSLYFHLPFCAEACYFCGCSVVYTTKEDKKVKYIRYLKKELSLLSKKVDTTKEVIQMHFGGGTPTYFSALQLEEIINAIKATFSNFSSEAEISCEIDPRYLNEEQMIVLSNGGFNRVSFGIQDFDEAVQVAVNRVQSFELTKNVVDLARKYNMHSVNVDLIYGLPLQNLNQFKITLELVKKLDVNRVAVFNYAHVPWMKATMKKINEEDLPTPDEKLEIFKYTIDFFESNGYKMIGMDHFAKPDDELFKAIKKGELHRNFQGYTTKGGAVLLGIGLTSIGEGHDYYAQNLKNLKSYEKALDDGTLPTLRGVSLSPDDIIRKEVIMTLMSNFKLDIKRIEKQFNIDFFEYFRDDLVKLDELVTDNLLTIDKDAINVSQTGTLIIRNIAMVFDAYLDNSTNRFSKTL